MTDLAASANPFRVGACLTKTLSVFFGNFVKFNLLGFLIFIPGLLVIGLVFATTLARFMMLSSGTGDIAPEFGVPMFAGTFGIVILFFALQYFLVAAVVHGTLQHLRGERAGFFASLRQALRRFFPVLIVAILSGILVMVGFMLLIVPGIIIALMLFVVVPVVMVENPGILASLSRSRELTKGLRWQLFGALLVAVIGSSIVAAILPIPFELMLPLTDWALAVQGLIQVAMQIFVTVFLAVLIGVAYHDLRVAKEGVSTEQLAAVFD